MVGRVETNGEALFFRMWSIKESYLKLTGKGIWAGLSSFEIQWEERVIRENGKREAMFAENLSLPGCSLCACFRGSGQTVRWKESGGIFGD
jgi:phosphopantetheinyl transferase